MPAPGFGATDLFSLGSNFEAQSSSSPILKDPANLLDALGNVQCETMINERTEHNAAYLYCNATPDIKTHLALFLTTFGDIFDSKKVTQLTIAFTAGAYATVDLVGHAHAANNHTSIVGEGRADVSSVIPAGAGFGVPALAGVVTGADADFVSATFTFTMQHVDVLGAAGAQFAGKNLTCRCEASVEFTGTPTTPEMTNFTTDSEGPSDANQTFDTFSIGSHLHIDLLT